MKALITAATSAHAYKLQRLLDQQLEFIYADQEDLPGFLLKDKQFVKIPAGDSLAFTHQLLAICLDKQIDLAFPLRKNELQSLAAARQLFEEYGIRVIVPSFKVLNSLFNVNIKSGNVFVVLDQKFLIKPDIHIHPEMLDNGIYIANINKQYAIYSVD